MKVISRRTEKKFTRKPMEVEEAVVVGREEVVVRRGLKIHRNVVEMKVKVSPREEQDQSLLLQLTAEKQETTQPSQLFMSPLQNMTLSRNIFFQYSPDSTFGSPFRPQPMNFVSLESQLQGITSKDNQFCTNDVSNFHHYRDSNASEVCLYPEEKISPFVLSQTKRILPQKSIVVGRIGDDQLLLRVEYHPISEARNLLFEEKRLFKGPAELLITRLKRYLKRHQSSLFHFYIQVIQEYQDIKLRQFLIGNSIKYSGAEIVKLQGDMNAALDICRAEDVMNYMLFSEQEENMVCLNLANSGYRNEYAHLSTNLWKSFSYIICKPIQQTEVLKYQMEKLQEFLLNLF